jgi:hypothetical protein
LVERRSAGGRRALLLSKTVITGVRASKADHGHDLGKLCLTLGAVLS